MTSIPVPGGQLGRFYGLEIQFASKIAFFRIKGKLYGKIDETIIRPQRTSHHPVPIGILSRHVGDCGVNPMKKTSGIKEIGLNDKPLGFPREDVLQAVLKSGLGHCEEASLKLPTLKGRASIFSPAEDTPTNKWITTPTGNKQIFCQQTFRLPGHGLA